ncbi:bifunctional lysylphosphatidylglycerol flippase/synthetase MprF [Scleromatobacter humisilvae]|uniref:Phosphatidylglycerol lysyltransferase n=1 Tax=Scleromatobacter humisilvae TaxID=2897159 RepID=A0A9X2BXB3_9BURK|nr:bifunctional lysylphosphatidylglycerol flippase/synthetase MprF [Scleromatobacter humisilvae]MCK9684257.1 bifunctional lysylphosphatidylglycerol flippase/synthetase MprF [Scleromatobacter humisilvae]
MDQTERQVPGAPLLDPADPAEWWARLRPWLLSLLGLALTAAIGISLRRLLQEVHYADVMSAVVATPAPNIAAALLATAFSYLALTRYDASALRYVGATVSGKTVLLTSFVAYALSNTVGLGPLSGGVVRMRLYSAAGVQPPQVARAIVFNAAAFGLGMLFFGALGLLWGAHDVARLLHLHGWALRLVAAAMLLVLLGFVWLCGRRSSIGIGSAWRIQLPPIELALRQLAISAIELAASALVLWLLLPPGPLPLPAFVAFYAIAITAGIISHIPGGIGVFETVMLLAAGNGIPRDAMLGALLLNRGIYYVLPLVVATGLLVVHELRSGIAAPVGRMAVRLSPTLLAALTLIAGIWLIVSGVTPFTDDARELLAALRVPLPLIEASHFIGSVAGLGLIIVARGILHRLDVAWWIASALAIVAAALALPKGIALHEAEFLLSLVVLLAISRRQFDRRSSFFAQHLEPEWVVALGGVVVACAWILFFAFKEVDYSNRLWWQFELDGQAPRSLRALTAVALLALAYGLWELLRPPAGELAETTPEEIERAAAIARDNPSSDACYALIGDKHLMFSPTGRSFLMFGKQGRSWVGLFGPCGDAKEFPDMVWRFMEMATDHGGRAAFYHVRPTALPLFLDCGLHPFKLGEHAHIELGDFDLKGALRANLRSGVNRARREGLRFEVIAADGVDAMLPALQAVSDAWLAEQRGGEKAFSVGRFDADYLRRFPVAAVFHGDRLIAFANLLTTDVREEAALDLMRYLPDAPPGTMDFLIVSTVLHLQAEGYRRFGLGMSPMAGMTEHRSAPKWQRIARLVFEHGDRFYNFRGLRSFKDKFAPVWEARFLAAPKGLATAFILADVTTLIGGAKSAQKT